MQESRGQELVIDKRSLNAACAVYQNCCLHGIVQPVCQRERGLQRFKSLRHAARFCSVFSTVCNQFRPGRHALSAPNYRTVMRRRWREWDVVSETTAFAGAA
jgi:transposase-like protein